jgi:hypothetical protein
MPMLVGFEAIRATVACAVGMAGFEMCRLEQELEDSAWHLWLLDSVEQADVALVDVTGHNPYVMYELGYVHRAHVPASLIVEARDERASASVRGCVCLPYGEGCHSFEGDLIDHLQQTWRATCEVQDNFGLQRNSSEFYRAASRHADQFDSSMGRAFLRVEESLFYSRLAVARRRGTPDPRRMNDTARKRCLLAWLLSESHRVDVMRAICDWSSQRGSGLMLAPSSGGRRPLGARTTARRTKSSVTE